MLKKLFTLAVGCFFIALTHAQSYQVQLKWDQSHLITEKGQLTTVPWDQALSLDKESLLPHLSKSFDLPTNRRIESIRLTEWNADWKEIDRPDAWEDHGSIPSDPWSVQHIDRNGHSFVEFQGLPIAFPTDSTVALATSIQWTVEMEQTTLQSRNISFKNESVLRTGNFYKIRTASEGIYKMDQHFFEEIIGINSSEINPSSIQLYTGEPGILPEAINKERIDDLEEIPLWFSGTENQFSNEDYFLFYDQGPSPWKPKQGYDWGKPMNPYSQYHYLYLRIDGSNGKRIDTQHSLSETEFETDIYLDHARYEVDKVNLLGEYLSGEGSGQDWYGDIFTNTRARDYSDYFQMDGLVQDSAIRVKAKFAARVPKDKLNPVRLTVNGNTYTKTISGVALDEPLATYAKKAHFNETLIADQDELDLGLEFPEVLDYSEGWLDFIQVETYRTLQWNGSSIQFSHPQTTKYSTASFAIGEAPASLNVWDITDPMSPRSISPQIDGNTAHIGYETSQEMHRFLAFESASELEWAEAVDNQNLHGMQSAEMLIIYHPEFEEQALRLRDHRIAHSGLDVRIVSVNDIYNEFSSGKGDPSGIRNFTKMIYDRSDNFRFMLLFGDASYDFRGLDEDLRDENYVPTYQTKTSLHPIYAYPTDDYFGLLSDSEGGNLKGALDIAVGRLPITSTSEAENLVDKIIRYDTETSTYGPWRLNLGYAADDGDNNRHFIQADGIAKDAAEAHPVFNNRKFYLDAFPRESTPGGVRFPQAKEAINNAIFRGLLVFNYLGHGGPFGLAQERVVTVNEIGSWENKNKLPLFITATCTFSPYDDPASNSGGELVLHNQEGGGIALFTTVRAVFSGSNKRLNDAVFSRLFKRYNGEIGTLGDIMKNGKNANSADTLFDNARKFALLGDPAMKLSVPKHDIAVTEINDSTSLYPLKDTLNALEKVTVKGEIRNQEDELIPDFSGILHIRVFDKVQTKKTLGQSADSDVEEFQVQNSVIFKGNASVDQGKFSFSFFIPEDINYELGQGKISLYAYDGQASDASGYYDQFIIGGSSDTLIDDSPPEVEVFMNTKEFESGDVTNERPTLYAIVQDDKGINVTGNSIGHDMVAVLDGKEENKYILNDYFESDLNDYTSGSVRYPLGPLEDGHHEIEVRAYDIANNVGIGRTEFVVVDDENKLIDHVMNYPNPFSNYTYFELTHNLSPGPVELNIQVFDNLGKQVANLEYELDSDGYRIKIGPWDGVSQDQNALANGIYHYRVILTRDQEGSDAVKLVSEARKMILMK